MLYNFLEKYFLNGIKYDSAYNWIDTLTYALIFVGAVWLLYEKVFKPKKIEIDRNFIIALCGWIIFGSSMRAAEDAEIFKTWLLVTPFFYIAVFLVAFPMLLLSLKFNKKIPYWKSWGAAGYLMGAIVLSLLPLKNFYGIFLSVSIWIAWIFVFWMIGRAIPKLIDLNWVSLDEFALAALSQRAEKFITRWNSAVLSAQMFDAASTFTALTYMQNFWEKHVLGSTIMMFFEERNILLINGSASWLMFALKLAVVPVVLYAIDKYGETDNEKRFLKMIILMLGLAVGLRNTLEIGMAGM